MIEPREVDPARDGGPDGFEETCLALFEHLHTHPEVSLKEHETAAFVADRLRALGLTPTTYEGEPGVVAEWGKGPYTVALRADMDALWQEVGGEWRANHSCGHDAHMTMVLGAADLLRAEGFDPPGGRVRLIFQPAEEIGRGALLMTERGAVDGVDVLFGVHVRPIEEARMGYASPAIQNGSSRTIRGQIHGVSAHAARPHLGVNAVEVAAAIVHGLQSIHLSPMIPYSVKMTQLATGGQSSNIIPDRADFALDARAQTNEAMNQLSARIESAVVSIAAQFGAEVSLRFGAPTPAAVIGDEARSVLARAIGSVLGEDAVAPTTVTPGGEDFHQYTVQRPNLQAAMLGLGCDLTPGLHHPEMHFDRSAIASGARILAQAVKLAFVRAD